MSSAKPGRLGVAVVSAGRVGAVLGAALREAGHQVVGASGVSEASLSRMEALLPGVPRMEPDQAARAGELVVLAVPDDALERLVRGLAEVGAWRPQQIVLHTSGAHGLAALEPAARAGSNVLALHPAMTFTGTSLDLARLRDARCAVTAAPTVLPIAQALAVEMGAEPVVVEDSARGLYHAALVHGANHVVTAVAQAQELLAQAGVADPGALLRPLVHASVEGAVSEESGALTTLTGPVVRGDAGTLTRHLAELAEYPEALAAYQAMAVATARAAHRAGRLGDAAYAEVLEALGETP